MDSEQTTKDNICNLGEYAGRGPGRPKGSKNKKGAIMALVVRLTEAMYDDLLTYYQANPGEFMPLLLKGMPDKVELEETHIGEEGGKGEFLALATPDKVRALADLMENYLKTQPIVEVIDVRPAEEDE